MFLFLRSHFQIELANRRCLARQKHELTKYELERLKKRIDCCNSPSLFDSLPISQVPLFDSLYHVDVRKQLYSEYRQAIEQSRANMFNLYMSAATAQMQHYLQENNNGIQQMWQDRRSLPADQRLAPVMIELIERRANIIAERNQVHPSLQSSNFVCIVKRMKPFFKT